MPKDSIFSDAKKYGKTIWLNRFKNFMLRHSNGPENP